MRTILILNEGDSVYAYQTQQRKYLIDFMSRNSQTAFTVDELVSAMLQESRAGKIPGKSTIYRLITKLVDDGIVKRFLGKHGRQFLYQIVTCQNFDSHLHLKCMKCGKLYHMDDKSSEKILRDVLNSDGFSLDEKSTILFGTCKECN